MSKYTRFTRTHLPLAALALVMAAATGSASAASATATTTSTVVTPISIAKATDLSFGSFSSAAAGTVTLSPDNTRAATGGVVLMTASAGTAAKFDVSGQTGATYAISLTGTTVLTRGGGTETMAYAPISALTASGATSGTVPTGTLTGGTQSIYVGGVLTVGASQAPGTYTGTVIANVDYN